MKIDWMIVRDTVTIDDAFAQELAAEIAYRDLAKGATMAIVARTVRHEEGYVLAVRGHPLLVVAESYDGNGGAIDTSGVTGAVGVAGTPGADKNHSQIGLSGGPGGDGSAGKPGAAASPLTLLALAAKNVKLIARGGAGGAGGAGGRGGNGAPGKAGKIGKFESTPAGNGGPGGDGGKGANGASGALVTFKSMPPVGLVAKPKLDGAGGKAGNGGAAGKGGKAGLEADASPGKPGLPGKAGQPGNAGPGVAPKQVTWTRTSQWWADVIATLGPRASQWADHRTRVGEYWFRRHRPRVPSRVSYVALARHEFVLAQRLDDKADRAQLLHRYLDQRLCPIGLPYDLYPVPDFPRYEDVLTDYGPMVQSLFEIATDLLLNAADVSDNRGRVTAELAHLATLQAVLQTDLQSAQVGVTSAQGELEQAETRLAANKARIEATQDEMEDAEVSVADQILGSVAAIAIAVVSIAAAAYSGGTSLAGLAATVGLLADVDRAMDNGTVDEYGNYVHSVAGDFNAWINFNAPGGPALTKDAKQFVGGLKDLIKNAKEFYDKVQTVQELFEAKVDGELQSKYKELLIAHIELTMARNIASLQTLRAGLDVQAAQQRIDQTGSDTAALTAHATKLGANISELAGIGRTLIRQAQQFADVLIKYWFHAARAVDNWTSTTDWSRTFAFDFGYLHPDAEDHAYLAADRGDPSRVLDLLSSYLQSWATLPGLIALRDSYEDHASLLEPHRVFTSVTDPELLAAFVEQGSVTVPIGALPPDHDAPKVEALYVALVGATAAFPNVEIDVEHPGSKWGPPPATAPVQCTFAADDLRPVPTDIKLRFWARHPAVHWRLSIDPASATAAQLDLGGLTQILLTVDYRSA